MSVGGVADRARVTGLELAEEPVVLRTATGGEQRRKLVVPHVVDHDATDGLGGPVTDVLRIATDDLVDLGTGADLRAPVATSTACRAPEAQRLQREASHGHGRTRRLGGSTQEEVELEAEGASVTDDLCRDTTLDIVRHQELTRDALRVAEAVDPQGRRSGAGEVVLFRPLEAARRALTVRTDERDAMHGAVPAELVQEHVPGGGTTTDRTHTLDVHADGDVVSRMMRQTGEVEPQAAVLGDTEEVDLGVRGVLLPVGWDTFVVGRGIGLLRRVGRKPLCHFDSADMASDETLGHVNTHVDGWVRGQDETVHSTTPGCAVTACDCRPL